MRALDFRGGFSLEKVVDYSERGEVSRLGWVVDAVRDPR